MYVISIQDFVQGTIVNLNFGVLRVVGGEFQHDNNGSWEKNHIVNSFRKII